MNGINRDSTFAKTWYKNYYQDLISFSDENLTALDSFVYGINLDSTLQYNYTNTGNWAAYSGCMSSMHQLYGDFVSGQLSSVSVNWSKVTGEDSTALSNLSEYFVGLDQPGRSTLYIQNVITPDYAEIDEMKVYVDTVLTPRFAAEMQFDSTVLFGNYTQPTEGVNNYEWNFGDGSDNSKERYPLHTFPAFDSSYIVCLTASNQCGTWTSCDTLYIDSAHWGGTLLTRKGSEAATDNKQVLSKGGTRLIAYPNPSDQSITFTYGIEQENAHAELIIISPLGQIMEKRKLNRPMDEIHIPTGNFSDGLYSYFLSINGTITSMGKMMVMH